MAPLPLLTLQRVWHLKASPEALWPFLADTNRFNHDNHSYSIESLVPPGERLPNGYRHLKSRFMALKEEPFQWVRPYQYGTFRRYIKGRIFADFRVTLELEAVETGGTQLTYTMYGTPGYWFTVPLCRYLMRDRMDRFDPVFQAYDAAALQSAPSALLLPAEAPHFVTGGRQRLTVLGEELLKQPVDPQLAQKLIDLIATGEDIALVQLRPFTVADHWHVNRREVLELFLWAVRVGLLEFHWEVLCPSCRGSKQTNSTLATLKPAVHCDTCNIDFTANFARSVELTFRPSPAIRSGDVAPFCISGPQQTPHVIVQQLLLPDTQREVAVRLTPGHYRLRVLELPGNQSLVVEEGGMEKATLTAVPGGWDEEEITLGTEVTLTLENATAEEQLFIIERTAWFDDAVTGAEVISLQLFRDLFADEALRPNEQISVGSMTILFTDLRGSTRFYREVGDAVAFGRVLAHFDTLKQIVAEEEGTIVKTIGDAIMGAFVRPVSAIRAILRAQQELEHPADGGLPLHLKGGVHFGPCIAVTLNGRLDYFGSTVNLAARLEGQSADGGIVVSGSVRHDPEVVDYLTHLGSQIRVESFHAHVKGFDDDFEFWRILWQEAA